MISFDKSIEFINVSLNDPQHFTCGSFEGQRLDHVKVDLVKHMPLRIVKDMPYAFNEGYLTYYCTFMTLMLSMPPFKVLQLT